MGPWVSSRSVTELLLRVPASAPLPRRPGVDRTRRHGCSAATTGSTTTSVLRSPSVRGPGARLALGRKLSGSLGALRQRVAERCRADVQDHDHLSTTACAAITRMGHGRSSARTARWPPFWLTRPMAPPNAHVPKGPTLTTSLGRSEVKAPGPAARGLFPVRATHGVGAEAGRSESLDAERRLPGAVRRTVWGTSRPSARDHGRRHPNAGRRPVRPVHGVRTSRVGVRPLSICGRRTSSCCGPSSCCSSSV